MWKEEGNQSASSWGVCKWLLSLFLSAAQYKHYWVLMTFLREQNKEPMLQTFIIQPCAQKMTLKQSPELTLLLLLLLLCVELPIRECAFSTSTHLSSSERNLKNFKEILRLLNWSFMFSSVRRWMSSSSWAVFCFCQLFLVALVIFCKLLLEVFLHSVTLHMTMHLSVCNSPAELLIFFSKLFKLVNLLVPPLSWVLQPWESCSSVLFIERILANRQISTSELHSWSWIKL